jgi:hypothetical protein
MLGFFIGFGSRPFITETRVPYVFQPRAHIEYSSCSGRLGAERAFEISRASVFPPELRPLGAAAHAGSRSGSHGIHEPWKDSASPWPHGGSSVSSLPVLACTKEEARAVQGWTERGLERGKGSRATWGRAHTPRRIPSSDRRQASCGIAMRISGRGISASNENGYWCQVIVEMVFGMGAIGAGSQTEVPVGGPYT